MKMPSLKRKRDRDSKDYVISPNDCTLLKTSEISDTISTLAEGRAYIRNIVQQELESACIQNKRKKRRTSLNSSEKLQKIDDYNREVSLMYDSRGSMWQVISVDHFRKVPQSFGSVSKTNGESLCQLNIPTGKNDGMFASNDTQNINKYFRKKHKKSETLESTPRALNNSSKKSKKRRIESHKDGSANEDKSELKVRGRTANKNQYQEAFVNSCDKIIHTRNSYGLKSEQTKLNVFNPRKHLEDAYNNVDSNTFEPFSFSNESHMNIILSDNCDSSNFKNNENVGVQVEEKFAAMDEKLKKSSEIENWKVKDEKESKNKKDDKLFDMKLNCSVDESEDTEVMRKHENTEVKIEIDVNCKTRKKAKLLTDDKEKENVNLAQSVQKEKSEKEWDMESEHDEKIKNDRVGDGVLKMKKKAVNKISDNEEGICENSQEAKSVKKEEESSIFNEDCHDDDDDNFLLPKKKVKRIETESEDEKEEEENIRKKCRKKLKDKIIDDESSAEENDSACKNECVGNDDSGDDNECVGDDGSDGEDSDDDYGDSDESENDENESEIEEVMLSNKKRRRMMAMEFLDDEAEEGDETEEEEEEETESEISEDENDEAVGVEQFIDCEAKEDMIFVKRKKKKMYVIDSDEGEEQEEQIEKDKQSEAENLEKTVKIMKKLTRIMTCSQLKCEALRKQVNKDEEIVNNLGNDGSIEETVEENRSESKEFQDDISGEVKQNEMLQNMQLSSSVNEELRLILGEGNEKRQQKKKRISERSYASDSECQRTQN